MQGGVLAPLGSLTGSQQSKKPSKKREGSRLFAQAQTRTCPQSAPLLAPCSTKLLANISWHVYRAPNAVNSLGGPWLMLYYDPLDYPPPSLNTALRAH